MGKDNQLPQENSTQPVQITPFQVQLINLLLITVPIVLIYVRILGYDFIEIDDGGQVTENEHVQSLGFKSIVALFTTPVVGMFQPLTSIMNGVVVALFGSDATYFRLLSLTLHISNIFLFHSIAKTLLQHQGKAAVLALLMAVHPFMVETVVWVSALSTLWFTLLFLISMRFYLVYLSTGDKRDYLLSFFAFLIGALFKVQIVPLVGVLFLCDYLKGDYLKGDFKSIKSFKFIELIKPLILNKVPFLLVALTTLYIAVQFRGSTSGFPNYDYNPYLLLPLQLAWYPIKLLLPFQLGIQYDWPTDLMSTQFYTSVSICIVTLGLMYFLRKKELFLFGILFYLGNIILHTSLFTQFLGPYADRYAYLSSFGLFIALFSMIPNALFLRIYWLLGIAIIGMGALAYTQVSIWKDTTSVWSNNLEHQSATFSNGMRGVLYYKQGRMAEAEKDFQIVADNPDLRLSPEKYAYLYTKLAILVYEKEPEKAYLYFKRVLESERSLDTLLNFAKVCQQTDRLDEAIEVIEEILSKIPNHLEALHTLTNLYMSLNQLEKVADTLSRLIEVEPKNLMNIKKRVFIYLQLNRVDEAKRDLMLANKLAAEMGVHGSDKMLRDLNQMVQQVGRP